MPSTASPNCVFCRIIGGDETVSIIHEDRDVIAFLDIQPLYPGHVLVVPKKHYKDLFFVPEALAARTFATARRILPGLRKATGCRAVNLFSPNGAAGGQDVFHFHPLAIDDALQECHVPKIDDWASRPQAELHLEDAAWAE